MAKKAVADCYLERNEGIRIDILQKLEPRAAPPLRAFFRRLGAAHVYEELIVPTLEKDKGLLVAAVRDRPWPPWASTPCASTRSSTCTRSATRGRASAGSW